MSETFEVHITGNATIHKAAKLLNIKTIQIENLNPQLASLGIEHMTSHVIKAKNFKEAKKETDEITNLLLHCGITRIKIESPYYQKYADAALYLESHFPAQFYAGQLMLNFPLSANKISEKKIQTIREYRRERFGTFHYYCTVENIETEMCLYDTNVRQDDLWFGLWGVPNG